MTARDSVQWRELSDARAKAAEARTEAAEARAEMAESAQEAQRCRVQKFLAEDKVEALEQTIKAKEEELQQSQARLAQ